jgi:hypothetical protein
MSLYDSDNATHTAKELIQAAIQSQSIKLVGTGSRLNAEANAEGDALYLSTLMKKLTEQITKK